MNDESHEHRMRGFWDRWRGTGEGRLFVIGLVGVAVLFAELAAIYILHPGWAIGLIQMVLTENFAGREAAISLALERGAPAWLAAEMSALQDLVVVALAYPVFLHALRRYHDRDNLVMRRLRKVEEAADRHRHVADRWGGIGIFVFMIIPFLVNGPLVASVAGRLAGMRSKAIVAPVILATCTAATAWAYGLDALREFTSRFHPKLPMVLTFAILSLVVLAMFIAELRDHRKEQRKGDAKK